MGKSGGQHAGPAVREKRRLAAALFAASLLARLSGAEWASPAASMLVPPCGKSGSKLPHSKAK
jgi:hypothetical protein